MRQNNDWNSYNAPVVLESWTFVSGYSAFHKSTLLRHGCSLLRGGGRKERSRGRGKENFYSCADGKDEERMDNGKERVRKPHQSCPASCWTATVDWLCKFLTSFLCSTSLFVCMQAFLLWSWLPRLAYFPCRVNLTSRHISPTTTIRVDYEIFTATRLDTAQIRSP